MTRPRQRLVLVGGGHAHLEVLRRAARRRFAGAELVLVSPFPEHHYSGMVPGYLQGTYAAHDLAFDLKSICRAAGARFVEGWARRVDADGRWVQLDGDAGTELLPCDLVSVDVGADARALDLVPGARDHALTVRPMTRAVALRTRLDALATSDTRGPDGRARPSVAPSVAVVGGGAGGVEVALAARRVLDAAGHAGAPVTLVDRAPEVLADYAPPVRRRIASLLARRAVQVRAGRAAAAVAANAVTLDDGERVPAALTVWLTGAAPTALTAGSPLPADDAGFWLVDRTLRSVGGGAVWGAGDCVSLHGRAWVPKAGVYAVRQGPVLAHNLRAAIEGGTPRSYHPQRQFLALLNTADGRAMLRWHALTVHSRWAWRLKDGIDRRFMRRYRITNGPFSS